ncbi:MAG: DNA polymerase III subunit delta [Ignavibacteriae bacterium]|nr:MAG: DNA polymerase III subunit delta [Ignavibacteriota bacterium]
MSKKNKITSVYSLTSELKNEELKPIYFFCGEDFFTIDGAIKLIEQKAQPFVTSDFDREVLKIEKKGNISEMIDLAYTFPFGSDKRILIIKNFENFSDKKKFVKYIQNPSDTTILIIANYGKISNVESEPYKSLDKNKQIFEASELKGRDLQNWVNKRINKLGFTIDNESLTTLIEIIGEDKSLVEMQLQKFKSFLGEKKEITIDEIKQLAAQTKEYNIFDLLNALGQADIKKAIKVIENLLDYGKDLIFIIGMLTKYFTVIAQSLELSRKSDIEAAKEIGTSRYFYINCKKANYFKNKQNLHRAIKALYQTDLALKTTSINQRTLSIMLMTEIFNKNS